MPRSPARAVSWFWPTTFWADAPTRFFEAGRFNNGHSPGTGQRSSTRIPTFRLDRTKILYSSLFLYCSPTFFARHDDFLFLQDIRHHRGAESHAVTLQPCGRRTNPGLRLGVMLRSALLRRGGLGWQGRDIMSGLEGSLLSSITRSSLRTLKILTPMLSSGNPHLDSGPGPLRVEIGRLSPRMYTRIAVDYPVDGGVRWVASDSGIFCLQGVICVRAGLPAWRVKDW